MYLAYIILAVLIMPQSQAPSSSTATSPKIPPADCSIEPGSCAMFNQMLAANDEDFAGLQVKENTTYVCFERQEFFAISFNNPAERRNPNVAEQQGGFMLFQSYADGVSRDNKSLFFTWYLNRSETHGSPDDENNDSYIDDREVTFVYDFSNIAKAVTTRTIKIRRSTLRFADTFLTPDAKGDSRYASLTGDCIVYPR
jgi:hypothetical protein